MFPDVFVAFVHARAYARSRVRLESGQATAEYGVVILIAVALGMSVLMLFTTGAFNTVLSNLVRGVLETASNKIRG
jgi:hypothetical protein